MTPPDTTKPGKPPAKDHVADATDTTPSTAPLEPEVVRFSTVRLLAEGDVILGESLGEIAGALYGQAATEFTVDEARALVAEHATHVVQTDPGL